MDYKFLSKINSPKDLKKLNIDELNLLCDEIRDCIITTVSVNGGHLSSNLGAVELTVAMHYVFDSPDDSIIFDVGHQCYTHKLLTGRFSAFSGLRREGGISGFMRPQESEHDPFISGHSSTAISSAFGLLKGRQLAGVKGKVIAVVGDGAMTGGMVYEALNNAGRDHNDLIIVLNDNKMSISKNVGAFARYLTIIRQKRSYFNFKRDLKNLLSHIPLIGPAIKSNLARSKEMLKHRIYYNSNIFEGFGFNYIGPVDGHDLEKLISIFKLIKEENRGVVLHTTTVKGKGYEFAEKHPDIYHGIGGFDVNTCVVADRSKDFSAAFGSSLLELAKSDDKICAVTASMPDGTGLSEFAKRFPKRFFDVGIAEQHAVTFSAGLAKAGMKPFFAVYSSFLQRTVDSMIHDVAIAELPVVLCVDRAGFVGADGETHQGLYDIPLLTAVPGMTVYSPSNYKELASVLRRCAEHPSVCAVRYPRGRECSEVADISFSEQPFDIFGEGKSVAVTFGKEFSNVYSAMMKKGGFCTLKLNKVFPIDTSVFELLLTKDMVVVFEESSKSGGIGEKIAAGLLERGFKGEFISVATSGFIPSATVERDECKFGLDTQSVINLMNGDKCEG